MVSSWFPFETNKKGFHPKGQTQPKGCTIPVFTIARLRRLPVVPRTDNAVSRMKRLASTRQTGTLALGMAREPVFRRPSAWEPSLRSSVVWMPRKGSESLLQRNTPGNPLGLYKSGSNGAMGSSWPANGKLMSTGHGAHRFWAAENSPLRVGSETDGCVDF